MSLGLTSASLGLCGLLFSQINDHFFKSDKTYADESTTEFLVLFALVMSSGMLLGSFILGPLDTASEEDPVEEDQVAVATTAADEQQPLLNGKHRTINHKSLSGLALLMHPVGFALYVVLFVALGIGYVYLANIGQILLALPTSIVANPQHLRNAHVSLFSLFNCGSKHFSARSAIPSNIDTASIVSGYSGRAFLASC